VLGDAVPEHDHRGGSLGLSLGPGGTEFFELRALVGGFLTADTLDRARIRVECLVHQGVGSLVRRPRHPRPRDLAGHQPLSLQCQRLHVDVLDLPASGHLLDHELGVHPHLDLGVRDVVAHELEPGDEAAVLRDVVGGRSDRFAALGDHLTGVGVAHEGAVGRWAGIAARAAVGLDDDASAHSRSPRSLT
jgi:hypothetical protein